MSMDPGMMQQMLMQKLQQGAPSPVGGGGAGPQMQGQTSPMNAAAQLAQKAMLVRSLQNNPTAPANMWQQRQANAMVPGTQAAGANAVGQNPQVLAMQQQMQQPLQPPMQPMMDPSLMPPPGVS